ncbi:hypothetical protein H9Q09_21595 [Aurantimonas sp. DM33-3]|uniref:rhamnan synthesis F family protein n=1 Tax=Aurantimonas sp. DM33-3 TaxID=2766955 RepID=UPI0016527D38|nr:rhamnan synthesis F family protein [Aurantimonas sp. DM33-3]MBC6718776.1 hypothetical protein [Aurantimonas sp. DM33-3]
MTLATPRFTIFAQIHYPEIWDEMVRQIDEAVDVPFALVMSFRDAETVLSLPQTSHLHFVERVCVENRGRDVLPFLECLRRLKDAPLPDIGLKLHTKKSPHRDDGLDWRNALILSLLETGGQGMSRLAALDLMEAQSRIGLIAPRHSFLPVRGRIGSNRSGMRRMADRMGIALDQILTDHARFPAGSMFWFRRAALSDFAHAKYADLFEPETGKLDGTMAHAAERLFALAAEHQGFFTLPMESVHSVGGLVGKNIAYSEFVECVRHSEMFKYNAFIRPLPKVAQRYESVMIVAHFLKHTLPKPLWQTGRTAVRRALNSLEKTR